MYRKKLNNGKSSNDSNDFPDDISLLAAPLHFKGIFSFWNQKSSLGDLSKSVEESVIGKTSAADEITTPLDSINTPRDSLNSPRDRYYDRLIHSVNNNPLFSVSNTPRESVDNTPWDSINSTPRNTVQSTPRDSLDNTPLNSPKNTSGTSTPRDNTNFNKIKNVMMADRTTRARSYLSAGFPDLFISGQRGNLPDTRYIL